MRFLKQIFYAFCSKVCVFVYIYFSFIWRAETLSKALIQI